MNPKKAFMLGFAICCAFIAYDDIVKCKELPWPPRFIGAGIVFITLDLFSFVQEELAGIVAIGFTLATVINTLNAKRESGVNYFAPECNHAESTVQLASTAAGAGVQPTPAPESYQYLQGSGMGVSGVAPQ